MPATAFKESCRHEHQHPVVDRRVVHRDRHRVRSGLADPGLRGTRPSRSMSGWLGAPSGGRGAPGASTGSREAIELRDGGSRYKTGRAARRRPRQHRPGPALRGLQATDQRALDDRLRQIDGTDNKGRLGANAILGISMAVARRCRGCPAHAALSLPGGGTTLPVPLLNVLNGGAHADNSVDLQEFMIAPIGASSFAEAMRMGPRPISHSRPS